MEVESHIRKIRLKEREENEKEKMKRNSIK